uniref:Putative secreted protein n=1 Tax=Anopheles darlingi TaxID=43151 RepID=A0A2M4D177_ANODA
MLLPENGLMLRFGTGVFFVFLGVFCGALRNSTRARRWVGRRRVEMQMLGFYSRFCYRFLSFSRGTVNLNR